MKTSAPISPRIATNHQSTAKDRTDHSHREINEQEFNEMEGDYVNEDGMHPVDDGEAMADGDANPIPHEDDANPPAEPPAEDLDGNWARPRRERVRALPKPVTPTAAERERHALTHMPYALWCAHCVRCRGRKLPHRRLAPLPAENVVPVIAMGIGYLHS